MFAGDRSSFVRVRMNWPGVCNAEGQATPSSREWTTLGSGVSTRRSSSLRSGRGQCSDFLESKEGAVSSERRCGD